MLILNAAGIPGRIVPALLSDNYLGAINTYTCITTLTTLVLLLWPLISTSAEMIPWATAFGFCAGAVASLLQAGIASLNVQRGKLGVEIGMGFSVVGFASLIGGPMGGYLMKKGRGADGTREKCLWMQVFTGVVMGLGTVILVALRIDKTGWKLWEKV